MQISWRSCRTIVQMCDSMEECLVVSLPTYYLHSISWQIVQSNECRSLNDLSCSRLVRPALCQSCISSQIRSILELKTCHPQSASPGTLEWTDIRGTYNLLYTALCHLISFVKNKRHNGFLVLPPNMSSDCNHYVQPKVSWEVSFAYFNIFFTWRFLWIVVFYFCWCTHKLMK